MYQVLIVDDHIHLVESLAITIPWEKLDIDTVHKAYSSDEALEVLRTYPVDIVITDIRMPGLSGLELIAKIRQTWSKIKCIILSGYNDFQYFKEALVNQAIDYLLKPVEEEELILAITKAIASMQEEWAEIISHQRIVEELRGNLPLLRAELLNELLRGKRIPQYLLEKKLNMYEIPLNLGDSFTVMLVRMEQYQYDTDINSLSLFEYAVGNIAEEIFRDQFQIWHCKDSYEYLVFLIKYKNNQNLDLIEISAKHLQHNVKKFLKGKISFLIGRKGNFPSSIQDMYETSLTAFRKYIGNDRELSIRLSETAQPITVHALQQLYEPPTLLQLLEVGRWEEVDSKLNHIFEKLIGMGNESYESLLEAYFAVANSLAYIAHKNGFTLEEIYGTEFYRQSGFSPFRSLIQFKDWTFRMIERLRNKMEKERDDARVSFVKQVQDYIEENLNKDVSLQAIAEHVFLNPSYLSSVYKLQTGEGLSEYIYRLRMEKAAYYLHNSSDKIYEISARLGFQNTNYFIKIFKKFYELTPQEYRENQRRIGNGGFEFSH